MRCSAQTNKMHAQYHFSTFHTVVLIYTSASRGWQFPQGSWFQHIDLISQRQKTYPKHPSLSPQNNEVWVHEKDLFSKAQKNVQKPHWTPGKVNLSICLDHNLLHDFGVFLPAGVTRATKMEHPGSRSYTDHQDHCSVSSSTCITKAHESQNVSLFST